MQPFRYRVNHRYCTIASTIRHRLHGGLDPCAELVRPARAGQAHLMLVVPDFRDVKIQVVSLGAANLRRPYPNMRPNRPAR